MSDTTIKMPKSVSNMISEQVELSDTLHNENGMGTLVQQQFADMMKAMTAKEKRIALKMFPSEMLWTELKRRYDSSITAMENIRKDLHNVI